MDSKINLIFFQKNEKTLEKNMSYGMLFAVWGISNNWYLITSWTMITEIMFMIQVCLKIGYQTTTRKTNNYVLTRLEVLPTLRMVLMT